MLSSLVHLKKLWEVRVHDRCCATNTESKDRKEESKDYYLNNNQPQHYFKDYYIPPVQKKWRKQMLHKSRLCFRKSPLKVTEQRYVKIFWAKLMFSWRQQELIWNLYHILNRNNLRWHLMAQPPQNSIWLPSASLDLKCCQSENMTNLTVMDTSRVARVRVETVSLEVMCVYVYERRLGWVVRL